MSYGILVASSSVWLECNRLWCVCVMYVDACVSTVLVAEFSLHLQFSQLLATLKLKGTFNPTAVSVDITIV